MIFGKAENFDQILEGVPFKHPKTHNLKLACCDCGSTHLILIENADKKNFWLTFFRDTHGTREARQERSVRQKLRAVVKKLSWL